MVVKGTPGEGSAVQRRDANKRVDDVNLSLPIGMGVRVRPPATSILQPLFFGGSRFFGQE